MLGVELRGQFAPFERRGDGRAGVGARNIRGRNCLAAGDLHPVKVDFAGVAFLNGAGEGEQVRTFGGAEAGEDLGDVAGLIVGVDGFQRNEDVESVAAGGLGVAFEGEEIEFAADQEGRFDEFGVGALLGVEIDEDVVGMIEGGDAGHPGVLIDAAQVGEIDEIGAASTDDLSAHLAMFGEDRFGAKPIGEAGAVGGVLLKEALFGDAVGIAAEGEGPVLQMREEEIGDGGVVVDEVALGDLVGGVEELVQILEAHADAVDLDGHFIFVTG